MSIPLRNVCLFCFSLFLLYPVIVSAEAVLLDVELPIRAETARSVTKTLERLAPGTETVIIQFRIPADADMFGRGSSFGVCYELASLLTSEKYQHIRFAAFMPQSVQGHAVLAALACKERILADHAEFGAACIDEPQITDTIRHAYTEIARRRALPVDIVTKMVDPALPLLQIETESGTVFSNTDKAENALAVAEKTVLIPAGQQGIFTAELARQIHLIDLIANDKTAAARGLGLKPDDLKITPVLSETGHAVRVDVIGLINSDKTGTVMRSIQNHLNNKENNVNFLCLYIDSPGGDLEASLAFASFLVTEIDPAKVRTAAYIPKEARSDAALIAAACGEIVLGPAAVLGDDGAAVFSANQIADARRMIKESLAKEAARSWSVYAAFADPEIEICEWENIKAEGSRPLEYFSEEEWSEMPNKENWTKKRTVKPKGQLLKIEQGKGVQFLADRTAKNFAEFKMLYGLEADPMLVEPAWTDQLVQYLSSPDTVFMVLYLVWAGLLIEGMFPGIGIGSFLVIAALFFFFWLAFLGGTANWLEISLFLFGTACLLLEIFVIPGFGIFGIGGIIAVVVSLVLASQTFIIPQNSYQYQQMKHALGVFVAAGGSLLLLGFLLSKTLDRVNKPKDAAVIQDTERLANYDHLAGQRGHSATPLVPAGKIRIGADLYDAVSDGTLIERDNPVEVVSVTGYKIVVRKI
ncbi:MAG: hypothetical protein LBH00_03395 [Planctomycetaceae bacterium]|jgi:membrane-bound ClpP family serine protease|nr:hypothetical protein [Planctomycetaceae bacterium]